MDRTDNQRLSHRELVERLVDAGAEDPIWLEFVSRFHGRIRLTAFRTFRAELRRNPGLDTGSPEEAVADLTQDVFLKLLESDRRALARFRGKSEHSIYTYLNTIVVNLVRDRFKSWRAQKTPRASASLSNIVPTDQEGDDLAYDQALVSDGPGPERFVAAQELRNRLAAVVAESSSQASTGARDRLIFQLHFIEGLTVGELARIPAIGLSTSGLEKCIRRIRGALKENLATDPGR